MIVVLINELDGSLRNQLVCSLAFVSSRLAFKICCSTWARISSWYLGACIAYRVSRILYLLGLAADNICFMTAFFISSNCFSPRYPLHSQATAPGRQGQSSRVESSVLNVNRASLDPISDSRDIHCSLLENVLFIIGKSTLNCWDRMRCFGGRLNCRLSVQYSHTPVCQLVSPIADHR